MKSSLIFTAALAVALASGCGRRAPDSGANSSLPPIRAKVLTVQFETAPVLNAITGTAEAVQRAQLAAKLMGSIKSMPFTLGQRVKVGDPLVVISAGEIEARVAQAESQFNQASRDLSRERELLPEGASTASTVKDLEDRRTGADAMLAEAKAMLSYATIRAPFDGVITRKFASVGDLASPGLPLIEIEGLGGFDVEAGVPESLAGSLSLGMSLEIQAATESGGISGRISEISSAADRSAHTVAVKIALPESVAIHSGRFVKVQIPGSPVRALFAPWSAITTLGQMERVFVAGNDNRAVLRLVKTGARRGDRVEVLSGLDDGDRVILTQSAGLREGRAIDIQQ